MLLFLKSYSFIQMNIDNIEEWVLIVGFGGYSVSNQGQVRNDQTGRILRHDVNGGYRRVSLSNQGIVTRVFVHRLVVQAFTGPIPEGHGVDHIDHNPNNNTVSNLRIVSRSENNRNLTTYQGREVEYIDLLPERSEPLTEYNGRQIKEGHYRVANEYYVKVGPQYRRLTKTRGKGSHRRCLHVNVRGVNDERITISWVEE
jgi:hypothetical protein